MLSKPSSRRAYDARSPGTPHNLFSTRPADATFNGVLYAVFCDFVDGDLETLRNFLCEYPSLPICHPLTRFACSLPTSPSFARTDAVDHVSPAMSLGEERIEALLKSLSSVRQLLLGAWIAAHRILF